ncbi:MAG: DUF3592 domain-containing protein [Gemmatimonadota bacterium]
MHAPNDRSSDPPDSLPVSRRTFVGGAVAFMGVVLLGFAAWWIVPAWDSLDWTPVEGTIVSSEVDREIRTRRRSGGGRTSHTVWIRRADYEYEVDGRVFRGDRVSFEIEGTTNRDSARAWVDRHPAGTPVTVLVDPDDPTASVLERGDGRLYWFFLGFGVCVILFGFLTAKRIIVLDRRLDAPWRATSGGTASSSAARTAGTGAWGGHGSTGTRTTTSRARRIVTTVFAAAALALAGGQVWRLLDIGPERDAGTGSEAEAAADGSADGRDGSRAGAAGGDGEREEPVATPARDDRSSERATAFPAEFAVAGDIQPWSVEGRYSGRIVRRDDGLAVRLDLGVIRVRPAHTAEVTVGTVRAALGRREDGRWRFRAASERHPVKRRLAPGDSLVLDTGLEFRLPGADAELVERFDLVFEHSLLRPGESEPYGWTWAAGPVVGQTDAHLSESNEAR